MQERHGPAVLRVQRRVAAQVGRDVVEPLAEGAQAARDAADGQAAADVGWLEEALVGDVFAELDEAD